jgi:hypothetical protein
VLTLAVPLEIKNTVFPKVSIHLLIFPSHFPFHPAVPRACVWILMNSDLF